MTSDELRVLHISPYVVQKPSLGGVPQSVNSMCEALREAGHNVTIWGTNAGNEDTAAPRRGLQSGATRLFPARMKSLGAILNTPIAPELMLVNAQMMSEFDLVHLHGYWTSFTPSIAAACRRAGVPFVLQPRGSLVESNQKETVKSLFQGLFRRVIVGATTLAIALTSTERDQLLAVGFEDSRIRIIPNSFSPPPMTLPRTADARNLLGLPPNSRVILYLGRLHPAKGLRELIQAFGLVKRNMADAVLAIAGPDEGVLAELELLVNQTKTPDVWFLGPLRENEKWSAYAAASVFCLPSVFEAFPRVVLEASSAGVPIILSDSIELSHFIEAQAVVQSATEPGELAASLTRVLSDSRLRSDLASNAKRCIVEFFSTSAVLALLEDAYRVAIRHSIPGGERHS